MENKEIEKKTEKSTLLLLLFLFFLFNAAHLFRTSINTLYFTEDISGDYDVITATVLEFLPETVEKTEGKRQLIPVFSFRYEGEEVTMEEPDFAFDQGRQMTQPFQRGEEYTFWIHKRWGKLMVPPIMGPQELGGSQLRISILFLLLAVAIWMLRNKIAKKKIPR